MTIKDLGWGVSNDKIVDFINRKEYKKSLGIKDMIFCMNSTCVNYWEDSCMVNKEDKYPENIMNSREESISKCKAFKDGTNYIYQVINYSGCNPDLNELLFIADYYGHKIIRFKLDEDSAIIEREDGTPMSIIISEYINEFMYTD